MVLMYGAKMHWVLVTPRVLCVYRYVCIGHAQQVLVSVNVFQRWSPVRGFNRLNCISVSGTPVAAPYIV